MRNRHREGNGCPGSSSLPFGARLPSTWWPSEGLADVASVGLKDHSGWVTAPSVAPAWHPAFYQNCSGHLQPVSAGNSLRSQVIITTFSPVLRRSFDSPHTHWNRQMHPLPFCPACRGPPKARLLQRRRVWGKDAGYTVKHGLARQDFVWLVLIQQPSPLFTPQGWAYLVVWHMQLCQLRGVKPGIVPLQCSDPSR